MTVINRERDRLASSLTAEQFAKAMAQLDLSLVPPERRKCAIMDHLMRIQAATIHNRDAAALIDFARRERRKLGLSLPPTIRRQKD